MEVDPMSTSRPGRRAADEMLAMYLARGWSRKKAADECGISTRTVYTRLQDPDFAARVAALRGELVADAVGVLSGIAKRSANTLAALLASESETTRLRAADTALVHLTRLREHLELQARIEQLEATLKGGGS
jgi:hypothetical protein